MDDLHRPDSAVRVALSIAGSDSGGGAGIQADLKTFEAFGVFGTTALTAVTAQNTLGVEAAHALPAGLVRRQIDAVAADLRPYATKTGMLASAEIVEVVIGAARELDLGPLVVDPVMVATSGDRLLDEEAVRLVRAGLVPEAAVVTPNRAEAAVLVERELGDPKGLAGAARRLVDLGAAAALVKGGHLSGDRVVDILWDGETETVWESARISRRDTHGTGCTLSAAITAGLARGDALVKAVDRAIRFTRRAIELAPGLGEGHGPLGHRAARDALED
ncbi:MAG: bifunctional hydroxymethylpyrimidine kinase/phosphomethylpyrimidine kinase [Gemmatimonadota bacterium]|nr:bifunctional hydroxymethylpyrimidine kinase/phosphomethylpyrimidine kinase [Gemmatimonadota bacterium]